jgi:hypothetical protein
MDPFVFISYCCWKILTKPGLQINQVIFDTLINSSATCFRLFSYLQAQLPNKCLQFVSHYDDISIVPLHTWVQYIELLKKYHLNALT